MTRQTTQRITCPKCGYSQETEIWSSINVTVDLSLREKLFDGRINQFSCVKCGHTATLSAPLLYHDMTRQFSVQYFPPRSLEDPDFIGTFEPGSPPYIKTIPAEIGYAGRPHIVFVFNDLLYHIIFRERISHATGQNEGRKDSNPNEERNDPSHSEATISWFWPSRRR
jgi:predicted RNA-binding Zn-ribbon protein involved in translation (DUF1610 family)